jgi:hypothetical protein
MNGGVSPNKGSQAGAARRKQPKKMKSSTRFGKSSSVARRFDPDSDDGDSSEERNQSPKEGFQGPFQSSPINNNILKRFSAGGNFTAR